MPAFKLRVLPVLDNDPAITYDVYVVDHPEFASGADDPLTAVLQSMQRILATDLRSQITVETVEDFAPCVPALQAYVREHLATQAAADVLAACIAQLRAAGAHDLVQYLEERRDLGQLDHGWQVRMMINKLAHIAALR